MVLAGAAIAGTAAVVSQAVSDIARGEVSDMGTYVSTAFRETVIGAISGAVFGPFGPMANLGGRMAFGAVQNGFESAIRQTMEGKGFSIATMAMDMGIGALTGGIMDSRLTKAIGNKIADARIVKILSNAFGDSLNSMTGWIGKAADVVKQKLIRDALDIKDTAATGWKKLQNAMTIKKLDDNLVPAGAGGNVKLHDSPDPNPSSQSQHHKDFFSESEAGKKELADRLKGEAEAVAVAPRLLDDYTNAIKNGSKYGPDFKPSVTSVAVDATNTSRVGFGSSGIYQNNPSIHSKMFSSTQTHEYVDFL